MTARPSRRRPVVGLVAAAAVALGGLTACGGGTTVSSYCSEVKAQRGALTQAADGDGKTALLDALPIFRTLQGKAPTDIADDWGVIVQRVDALQDALTAAHVDPATYDPAHPPAGVSKAQQATIATAAAALTSQATSNALGAVQQEALDVCHTRLTDD